MAKSIIERPPFIFDDNVLLSDLFDMEYVMRYKEVDREGKYFYFCVSDMLPCTRLLMWQGSVPRDDGKNNSPFIHPIL